MAVDQLKYRIAFAAVRGMGHELAQRILDIVPSEADFFRLPLKELAAMMQIKNKIIEDDYRRQLVVMAERELEFVETNGIGVTYFTDDDFPQRLVDIADAPILLYYKGDIACLNAQRVITVVGTRHATPYGQHFCDTLVADIANKLADTVVVSGLAYGIDVAAHRAALANDVTTAAVLAHGLGMIYPAQHRNTAREIVKRGGVLVTEYPSQSAISRGNFLARNRIVAGLADCTIVVESAEKGGAMTTASIAASYNRDVFAVPGKTSDVFSAGCNRLIRNNTASLITCCDDLTKSMRWEMIGDETVPRQKTLFPEITAEEKTIVDYLRDHPDTHVNTLRTVTGQPMHQLLNLLVELEFKGIIIAAPGNKFSIA